MHSTLPSSVSQSRGIVCEFNSIVINCHQFLSQVYQAGLLNPIGKQIFRTQMKTNVGMVLLIMMFKIVINVELWKCFTTLFNLLRMF